MRVALCGTLYGAAYVRALWRHEDGLQLVALLARGSERSRILASRLGVPLYRELRELPPSTVDLACVAVGGEAGVELTLGFLRRGSHVLLEHPVAPEPLAAALAEAASRHLVLHVNSHYGDLEAPQHFLAHFAALRRRSRLLHLSLATNPRALFSCLELAARALGGLEPLRLRGLDAAAALPAGAPLVSIDGDAAGVAITVQCLRIGSAADDGSAAWISHRLAATFEAGTLLLGEASGPALWLPAIGAVAVLAGPAAADTLSAPAWTALTPAPPTWGSYLALQRDQANRLALRRVVRQLRTAVVPAEQDPAHLLGVSRAWDVLLAHLGPLQVPG